MWDEYTPLQLLKTMPKKLNQENLSKIQMVIDADKYKNSLVSGFDLCGIYAPFCRGCDKTSIYPCAIAYIRMMQADGMNIEIDASPTLNQQAKKYNAKIDVPGTQPAIETTGKFTSREVKIAEYKSVKSTPAVREIKFSEPKVYKSKIKETANEIAVTDTDEEPVLVLPEIKDTEIKNFVSEDVDETNIFIPVKETVNESVKEVKEVHEKQPEVALPPAPVKDEPKTSVEPVKRRIRIAVARRKL